MTALNKTTDSFKDIVFFDGVCNLCNGFVDFALKKNKNLYYCSLQSPKALNYIDQESVDSLNSVIFLHKGKTFNKSTAVLLILIKLYEPNILLKSLFKAVLWTPKPLRDFFYMLLSSNRYRLFGKRETCRVPSAEEKKQFIDELS